MDNLTLLDPRPVAPDTEALTTHIPIPGLGTLAANAFLIRAAQPVLVDAGIVAVKDAFMQRLRSAIAVEEIRWLWLTHTDPDHVGAVEAVLAEAPRARLVTTFLGLGKLGLSRSLPPERIYLLNPGQSLDVGDRSLVAWKPPTFDAPETTALFDPKTEALFTADAFGALTTAPAEDASAIPPAELREGILRWASIDVPWLSSVDQGVFGRALEAVRRWSPRVVLGSHLPPARGLTDTLLDNLAAAREVPPFVGPDQAAMTKMMLAA